MSTKNAVPRILNSIMRRPLTAKMGHERGYTKSKKNHRELEKRPVTRQGRRSFVLAGQICVAASLCLVAWSSLGSAQDRPALEKGSISCGAEIALKSGHADRGFVINDRPVVQPVVWVTGRAAEVSLWGSFPLVEATDGSRPQILELELTSEHQWDNFWIAPAFRMFFYHEPMTVYSTRSMEGWLYLSYDAGPFSLFSNHSIDILTYQGAYYGEAGIESEWRVSPAFEVGGSFGLGWASSKFNEIYVDIYKSAFNRVGLEGWLKVYVEPQSYISTRLELSTILDPAVRSVATRPTFFFAGLITGVEF